MNLTLRFLRSMFHFAVVFILGLSLLSCTNQEGSKKYIELTFYAAKDINPDINGRPSPLAISIFQLANTSSFIKTDYMSLLDPAGFNLGRDLIAFDSLMLMPGEIRKVEYPIAKEEKALAIIAGYRSLHSGERQVVYEYPSASSRYWYSFGGKNLMVKKLLVERNAIVFSSD